MFWLAEVFNGGISRDEARRIEQWARRQRAEAVHQLFAAVGRGLGRGARATFRALAALVGRIRRWHQKRVAIRELNALSDHLLRDIGLHRGDIPSVVEGLVDSDRQVTTAAGTVVNPATGKIGRAESSDDGRKTTQQWQRAA